jgi:hypothetical protein
LLSVCIDDGEIVLNLQVDREIFLHKECGEFPGGLLRNFSDGRGVRVILPASSFER